MAVLKRTAPSTRTLVDSISRYVNIIFQSYDNKTAECRPDSLYKWRIILYVVRIEKLSKLEKEE